MKETLETDREIRRAVVRLGLPIVGSNLLQRGVGIVDALMVGRLGAAELAAVGLAQLLIMFFMALVYGLGIGNTVMVAFHTGARDEARRAASVRGALLLGLGATALLGVTGLATTRGMVHLLGARGRVVDLTVSYLTITWACIAFKVYLHLGSTIFHGFGDTRTPLKVVALVNVVHVIVGFPLIFGLWGAPRMGVAGAAVADAISEAMGAGLLLAIARRRDLLVLGDPWLDRPEVRRILAVGIPAIGERTITHGMQIFFARMVIGFGVAAYAAHQVGLNIEALSFLPGLGFAQAATTLVGQRLGAGDPGGARRSGHQANLMAMAVMSFLGVTFILVPGWWVRLFTGDPDILAYGRILLPIMGVLQPPLAWAMVLSGGLRGAGETRTVMVASIVGGWLVRLPVAYVGGVGLGLGIVLVWVTMVLDWVARGAIIGWRYWRLPWGEVKL